MAVSGTISQTVFTTRRVIDTAFRRCKIPSQSITGEMIDIAFDELYLMLSEWANQGLQLWCIEKLILPMYQGVTNVPMPKGTVELLNQNLRRLTLLTPVSTTTSSNKIVIQLDSSYPVTTIGIDWVGSDSTFHIAYSNDDQTWFTVDNVVHTGTTPARAWYDFNQFNATYISLTYSGTPIPLVFPIANVYIGNTPYEITMARLNRDDYINLPNKTFQGRPLQFWYDKQRDIHQMVLWPTPDQPSTFNQITAWRKRYIMDVGTSLQQVDVPQRWFDAMVYGLATRLAEIVPTVTPDILTYLMTRSAMALQVARAEERDNSPIYWSPNLRVYTR